MGITEIMNLIDSLIDKSNDREEIVRSIDEAKFEKEQLYDQIADIFIEEKESKKLLMFKLSYEREKISILKTYLNIFNKQKNKEKNNGIS